MVYPDMNEIFNLMQEYALDNENYKEWREIHGKAFGKLFLSAFDDSTEAQIRLTAALIRISKRDFNVGLAKLLMLERFCINDFDSFALSYFTGLCYEFLENEGKIFDARKLVDNLPDYLKAYCQQIIGYN